jgi:vitamin B12 transporter
LTRYFIKFVLIILFLHEDVSLSGQHVLDSVIIKGEKVYAFDLVQACYEKTDSTRILINTPDFLQNIIGGQVQMSSPGGLHTLLHRGMGTRHLPILWNGINIQSVVNGSFDYNLIPVALVGDVSFYSFGSPTLTGNNSLAGALTIEENKNISKLQVTATLSSLQNYMLSVLSEMKTRGMTHQIGVSYSIDKNRYLYRDGNEIKKRTTTNFNNRNIIYRNQWVLNPKNTIEMDFWWQDASRNIPVSITSAPLDQMQNDRNLRLHLNHKYYTSKYKFSSSLYYMKEDLDYFTPSIDSRSEVDIYQAGLEITEYRKNDHHLFVKYRNDIAHPNFYTNTKNRNTINFGASKKVLFSDKITSQISIRQDLVDKSWMPTAASILVNYKNTSLNIAKNYNLPGFNDLYWPSGGNVNLKTEKIIQAELGSKFDIQRFHFVSKVYFNIINDWIQWVPGNSGIFSPINQKKVRSTGFEMDVSRMVDFTNFQIRSGISYAFNSTTALEHYTISDQVGKQLIYVPKHKINTFLSIHKKQFDAGVTYRFTSKRYDTSDNSASLPANHLVDLNVGYQYKSLRWQLNVQNVLNEDYAIVRFFPLPRRHFNFTLRYMLI